MNELLPRIGLVLLFILIAGVFVAFEIALVSLRDSQVQQLSHRGRRGRLLADLVANPTRFLAAAQVGVTVTGFTRPVIALLTASTNVVVRLFGVDPKAQREAMSGEELRDIVAAHEELSDEERELIDEVFEASDRELREVMVPRTDVVFLDGDMPVFKAAKFVSEQPHSRYPVTGDSSDDVIGFIHLRDVLAPGMAERSLRVSELAREIARFPGTKYVIPTLSEMRRQQVHMAVVEDEYGGTAGIVTMEDLVEEVVGDIRDEYDVEEVTDARTVDGLTNLEDFAEDFGVQLPEGPYETVAGFIVAATGALPEVGQTVEVDGHVLRVESIDGRRVARVGIEHRISTDSEALPE